MPGAIRSSLKREIWRRFEYDVPETTANLGIESGILAVNRLVSAVSTVASVRAVFEVPTLALNVSKG